MSDCLKLAKPGDDLTLVLSPGSKLLQHGGDLEVTIVDCAEPHFIEVELRQTLRIPRSAVTDADRSEGKRKVSPSVSVLYPSEYAELSEKNLAREAASGE